MQDLLSSDLAEKRQMVHLDRNDSYEDQVEGEINLLNLLEKLADYVNVSPLEQLSYTARLQWTKLRSSI